MSLPFRCVALALLGGTLLPVPPRAATAPEAAWRDVNPALLSGGLFAALDAEGAFGGRPVPPRARIGHAEPSKGRPPAVLDPRVGRNVRLGDDPAALPATQRGQAEAHLVRSAATPGLLLATFQEGRYADSGAIACGYAVSQDGGFTWSRALIPNLTAATGGRFNRATDPVAGAGPQGDLYLQTLGSVQGTFALAAVVVSRSTDGGVTWSAPATVFESTASTLSPDKNWIAVNDYPGTPNPGRLVSTWTSFRRNATGGVISNPLAASVSEDRGSTWSAPIEITPAASSNQGSQPVFLPDGSLLVVYVAFNDPNNVTRFSVHAKRSVDGGRTFPAVASVVAESVTGWDDADVRDGVFLPSASVARDSGDVFVTFVGMTDGSPRVLVTRSVDRGASWSPPVVASDQPPGVSVMNPAVVATPDGRTVSVVFMDKRNAPDGRNFVDHYAAHSFDGGSTWQPSLRLTTMSSDIRDAPQTTRGAMLGDYLGVAPAVSPGHPAVGLWCDTRTGDSDPYATRFAPTERLDYDMFAALRGRPVGSPPHLVDDDADGGSNYLEFLAGTDPWSAEAGNELVLRLDSPTHLTVLWTERSAVHKLPLPDGISLATPAFFAADGFTLSSTIEAAPAAAELPTLPLRPGLVWRGVRVPVPAGEARVAARSVHLGAGLPVQASTVIAAVQTRARLINLSTRGQVRAGGNLILGFVIDGQKSMLLRAAGPALLALGVGGVHGDPALRLSAPTTSGLQHTNDNWQQQGTADGTLFTRLGAFPFATNSLDAALQLPLGAQAYTCLVNGPEGTGGVALVEAYDADAAPGAPDQARLLNLSTRGEAGVGDATLIAGFVITGDEPRQVLLRAVGPGLLKFSVGGTLGDPVLTLYRGANEIARNDDWEVSRSPAAIAAMAQRVGAFALDPASLDAALLVTLLPGAYTVVVTSADGGTGNALVEVYDAD